MIIDKNIHRFIVFSEDSVLNALSKINTNRSGIAFCVSSSGVLEGVVTDGDVRRWITENHNLDISLPVILISNRAFVSLPHSADDQQIRLTLSDRITHVPLVDKHQHLVAVAHLGASHIRIGSYLIGVDQPAFLIAEIGNNHNGSPDNAKRLIDLAVEAGADCAKFQMRTMDKLYRNDGDASDASADLGAQYTLDLLSRFQLNVDQMFDAFDYCQKCGILPLCTPWDIESLHRLEEYGLAAYKVASADLTNDELLASLARTRKPLICSTGMSNEIEIINAVKLLKQNSVSFALLHCNSTYPAPFKDINLNYMERLQKIADCVVGYSGHERGISVAIAAVAKGAKVIEKHLTLDRSWEGNDHRVSLLANEFKAMVQGIREIEQSFGSGDARRVTQGEMMNRETLAKSVVASRNLRAGDIITSDMLSIRSPGQGLPPYRRNDLIGRKSIRDMAVGDCFFVSDLDEVVVRPRAFKYRRPYGIPVRYHDVRKLAAQGAFDLFEFHLSYKDLDEDFEKYLKEEIYDFDLIVHSPELFAGDHIMDLSSQDPEYRARSIAELQRVVAITRRLSKHFSRAIRPMIIINAGGFSADGAIPVSDRRDRYRLIAESLSQIDSTGVEIIPQTMPPFPWHFGGQRYHNLFMTADEITSFCREHGYRICLDISHSQLACAHFAKSFRDFLEEVAPMTAHIHMVDAEGVDAEGLQIGDGIVDFAMVAEVLDRLAPKASFIPEIWQGHKNEGAGFWIALDKLERWF
jgi:sialic acid synthase SpsE/sugar phosphate isomerase/epimerase